MGWALEGLFSPVYFKPQGFLIISLLPRKISFFFFCQRKARGKEDGFQPGFGKTGGGTIIVTLIQNGFKLRGGGNLCWC